MLAVHVRINDEATGRPVPVWLRITDATGRYLPPLGRLADFATAPGRDVGGQVRLRSETFAFVDGACEARLPPGELTIEIERGFEYSALSRQVHLTAGQLSLRLSIGRWIDWSEQGWIAGDVRAHELTPRAAALEGAASGLSVVQLLARQRPARDGEPPALTGLLDFSGTEPALEAYGCHVAVNTLNEHPVLGAVALLNSHRPVFPMRFGAPDGPDDWSVADWCDQCHRKKGLVVWPDLPRLTADCPQGEALAALILGKIDAYEIGPLTDPHADVVANYHRLLDCGLRPVLVGGSGKESNAAVLGSMRTYARGDNWIDAVRAGRTFVTTGPLLSLSVADQGPGSVIRAEKGQRVRLRAEAQSAVPFDSLDLLVNGEIQLSKTASGNRTAALLETDLTIERGTWIAATCYSPMRQRTGPCVFAHTNPVFVEVPDEPLRPSGEVAQPLLDVLARTRSWVQTEARCETDRQRQHLLEILDEATARLTAARR